MNRTTAIWFGVAGFSILARTAIEFAAPAYYDAASFTDYAAVVTQTAGGIATGTALVMLWRDPPVARGSVALFLGGVGAALMGLGNLLEDAFNVEAAVWAFFGGGILMMTSLVAAGVSALTVGSAERWSGVFFLFAAPGAMLGFGGVMMAVAWIALGLWIVSRRHELVVAISAAVLPAAAFTVFLYGEDVVGGL